MRPVYFKVLWIAIIYALPSIAWASSKKLDWIPWLIGIAITSSVLGWWSAKRSKMLDNIHLRIIGFSVYFWLYVFGQMLILMVLFALSK